MPANPDRRSIAFDRIAHRYDETRGFPPGIAPQAAALIRDAAPITPTSRIVESGIGTGRIALSLAPYARAYFGVDLARPMLDRLRANRTAERIHIAEGNAVCLPYPSNTFDAAVVAHIFHLIPDWSDALAELGRVLKPDGVLVNTWIEHDDVMKPIYDALHAELPDEKRLPVGLQWDDRSTFLPDAGWRPVGEPHTLAYTFQRIPASMIGFVEQRTSSSLWRVSDPAQPITHQETFHAAVFRPPAVS
jgi:ubiquinone/menaquinone biosynthesis C-methylase UbiE